MSLKYMASGLVIALLLPTSSFAIDEDTVQAAQALGVLSNPKPSSKPPAKKESKPERVNVIKLEDILSGKYSGDKKEQSEKVGTKSDKNDSKSAAKLAEEKSKQMAEQSGVKVTSSNNLKQQSKETQANKPKNEANESVVSDQAQERENNTGWVYLGKYVAGHWEQNNAVILGLKGGLPTAGKFYHIRAHANVRKRYPTKEGVGGLVRTLTQGSKVKLLAIHNSGRSGHYWARIQWQ